MKLLEVREELSHKDSIITELNSEKINLGEESVTYQKAVEELKIELQAVTEQKIEVENELIRESENIRCLKRELSNRTDKLENEKDSLVNRLTAVEEENGVLKSANREIKEEYDKCLIENQKLVEVISKRQKEVAKIGKENQEKKEVAVSERNGKEKSPERAPERVQRSLSCLPPSINSKCLESEVESLRQVLALKTDEVTELRRQEMALRENADRVPKLISTIAMLEGKVEDLQTQLSSQTKTAK